MEPITLGLIGAGAIAGAHLRAATQVPHAVRIAALAEPNPANLQRQSVRFGITRTYAQVDELLAAPDIEGVIITTPNDTHASLAIAAAKAGKHVLVEKPMACSLVECQAMMAAARHAGVQLMVAQCQRYDAHHRALKGLIDRGELGTLRSARIESMQNAAAVFGPEHWLYDGQRAGGGIVISVAIHKIDLLRYMVGNVASVRAECRAHNPWFRNGAEDLALATLKLTNGALAQMYASWTVHRLRYSENFMLFGDKGTSHSIPPTEVQLGPPYVACATEVPAAPPGWSGQFGGFRQVEPEPGMLADSFANQLAHFAECCRNGRQSISSAQDNYNTMATVMAIYQSARTGQEVQVQQYVRSPVGPTSNAPGGA
jgi:predicted dehydrogenase